MDFSSKSKEVNLINQDYRVFRYSEPYLSDVLKLIERSDSTSRDEKSWRGLGMTAMLTEQKSRLIGALPFEPRSFMLGDGKKINVLWISAAHVDPEHRRRGIGSQMDQGIKDFFSPEFDAVFALRSDEGSDAYRWYRRIGYCSLLDIVSLKKAVDSSIKTRPFESQIRVWDHDEQIVSNELKIHQCFQRANSKRAGFVERNSDSWSRMIQFHYYKRYYRYKMVSIIRADTLVGYCFLGETSMKDRVKRFDILECVLPDQDSEKQNLINAVMTHARQSDIQEVRVQFSEDDELLPWFESFGFSERWRTQLLGRMLDPFRYFDDQMSSCTELNSRCKVRVKTPLLGERSFGSGGETVSLDLRDEEFQKMLFRRLSSQRIPIDINSFYHYEPWRYFQLDYV